MYQKKREKEDNISIDEVKFIKIEELRPFIPAYKEAKKGNN